MCDEFAWRLSGAFVENSLHTVLDCSCAWVIWYRLVPSTSWVAIFGEPMAWRMGILQSILIWGSWLVGVGMEACVLRSYNFGGIRKFHGSDGEPPKCLQIIHTILFGVKKWHSVSQSRIFQMLRVQKIGESSVWFYNFIRVHFFFKFRLLRKLITFLFFRGYQYNLYFILFVAKD